MQNTVKKINNGGRLGYDEARAYFEGILAGAMTPVQIAAGLIAMKTRGETVDELAALVAVLNAHKRPFDALGAETIDTCGTGGDGKSTVNISTAVSVICASMGCAVVKHGNTAQSGAVGSADVLAELGLDVSYADTSAGEFFKRHGYVFLMAPLYHPALKGIGPIRRELGVPTIINFAAPLANPAEPSYQIIGISRRDRLDFYARAVERVGRSGVTVYASRDCYDEVSSKDATDCIYVGEGGMRRFTIEPSDFFTPFDMPVARNREEARKLFLAGLSGEDEQIGNLFALNAALALRTMGRYGIKDGFHEAKRHIIEGTALRKLCAITGREAFDRRSSRVAADSQQAAER